MLWWKRIQRKAVPLSIQKNSNWKNSFLRNIPTRIIQGQASSINPIPNRSGHVIYSERADFALTW